MRKALANLFVALALCAVQSYAQQTDHKNATGKNGMVVSARQEASLAGLEILRNGGNAFDAAVTVHFVLAVVYPQAGNLGGGGFMVAHTANGDDVALDFREKAPLGASRDMYLDDNGNVISKLSLVGLLAAGVPGSVNGMYTLHKKYGSMPWKDLIQPAIEIAENGYVVTDLDAGVYKSRRLAFIQYNPGNSYFQPDRPFLAGDTIVQKDLAKTLKRIAEFGNDGFYDGETASLIVNEMNNGGGLMTLEDLKNYQAVWRKPITTMFYGHRIVTMPPPSSGGIALCQMLYLLEKLKIKRYPLNSAEYISLLVEVERIAYADRSEHLGDPDFYPVPVNELLSPSYLNERGCHITALKYTPSDSIKPTTITKVEGENTTHYSIVDKYGNTVSITTTLNSSFGSKVFVTGAGFLLNNEMDDFSAKPGVPNQFGLLGNQANAIAPGKRMLSSMTPTLVLKGKKTVLVTGTPGGATIITSVLQNILQTILYKKSVIIAANLPRFHHQWYPDLIYLEEAWKENPVIDKLESLGYPIQYRGSIGRVDAIVKKGNKWFGAGDPRGDDAAAGY